MTTATFKISSFFILLGLASACNPTESNLQEKTFFDLERVIENEINYLSQQKPTVQKTVRINDETEEISTNDLDWKKELEIIIQSDLNKAAYKLSYDEIEKPNQITYQLKQGENLPVSSLQIFTDNEGELIKINSIHTTDNYLYKSTKNVMAEFSEGHLSNYEIKGNQKLFVGSEKTFEIAGKVIL